MIEGTCHCGGVRIEVPRAPRRITSCNCSICRRYGSLMAYYPRAKVRIRTARGGTQSYIWGDQYIRFVRCAQCGCFMCWLPTARVKNKGRMGVNMRNFDPAVIAKARVRRFDGASTWKYLD